MSEVVLIGDIGGTNARFALTANNGTGYLSERVYTCRDFATPADAIREYLHDIASAIPARVCLAVAGPISDGQVSFTNNNWQLHAQQLQSSLGSDEVRLLNDFEAIAHCLPALGSADLLQLGLLPCAELQTDYVVAVLGPGTGLGVATLISANGQRHALATEGGHVGFAAESDVQLQVLARLQSKHGRVSTERLLSGLGVENLYWALSNEPDAVAVPGAAEIFEGASTDQIAQQTVDLFYQILGQVAGDIALATGAFDGVYLAGGIAQRYAGQLTTSGFRAGFESKGRHANLMQRIPTSLITHPQPGLLGAAVATTI